MLLPCVTDFIQDREPSPVLLLEFRVLSVITPEEYEGMNTNELGDIIHSQMKTALDEIRTDH